MTTQIHHKRRFERAFFSTSDSFTITVIMDNGGAPLSAKMLSLSAGGLSFSIDRQSSADIKVGTRLTVSYSPESFPLEQSGALAFDVKYKLDYESYTMVTVGGSFPKISPEQQQQINQFVLQHKGSHGDSGQIKF